MWKIFVKSIFELIEYFHHFSLCVTICLSFKSESKKVIIRHLELSITSTFHNSVGLVLRGKVVFGANRRAAAPLCCCCGHGVGEIGDEVGHGRLQDRRDVKLHLCLAAIINPKLRSKK